MARKNKTRFAILGILSLEPMSGYEIRKFVKASIGYFWHESYGQIYPVLKEMESEGLLGSKSEIHEKGSEKKTYSLTKEGKKELRSWLGKPVEAHPYRNELLLKLFFGRQMTPKENIAHLERAGRQARYTLKIYESIAKGDKKKYSRNPNLPFWMFTLDYGIEVVTAELQWIEATKKEMAKFSK